MASSGPDASARGSHVAATAAWISMTAAIGPALPWSVHLVFVRWEKPVQKVAAGRKADARHALGCMAYAEACPTLDAYLPTYSVQIARPADCLMDHGD